jgi:hypothetical protein
MRRSFIVGAMALAASLMVAPASAQFGLPSIGGGGGALPIPGLGGGGGGGFSNAAAALTTNLKTALYNQVMAIALVQDAMGDKKKAAAIRSQAAAIQSMKTPSKDPMEKTLKVIEQNPINREGLARVNDAEGKKKVAQAQGHMDVVIVYNGLALASAGAMIAQKPGPQDIAGAPAILEAAQFALTAIPTQTENSKKFNEAMNGYMKENNVPKLSNGEKVALTKKTGATCNPECVKLMQNN